MATLLILGSKPDPIIPDAKNYDALACANASGRSALRLGLPDPTYTVMSTVLTSGHKAANSLALQALADLRTETLYLYPRRESEGRLVKRMIREIKRLNVTPWYFKWRLRSIGYHFDKAVEMKRNDYHQLVSELCDGDQEIIEIISNKQPSTGIMALVLGLSDRRFDRFIMSGFSFEITHAYAHNPLIDELGSTRSKHANTDIAVLRVLSRRFGNVFTTEPVVHQAAAIPLLSEAVNPAIAMGA